jgi:hypothetical protein
MFERIKWYIKQILPLTYRTKYRCSEGHQHYTVWNMWLGRSYNMDDVVVREINQMSPNYLPTKKEITC